MKSKVILFVAVIGALIVAQGCKKGSDFLDPQVSNDLNGDAVFKDSTYTSMFLNRIYYDIGFTFQMSDGYQGLSRFAAGGHMVVGGEASPYRYNGLQNTAPLMAVGNLSPETSVAGISEMWTVPWANIRRCNLLMQRINETPVSAQTKSYWIAQARFLRAWYYFLLVRSYAGVPLIGDKVFDIEDKIEVPRSSYSDCVKYIVAELDAAAAALPSFETQIAQDYGRATKGAALAVKARTLLYAASPLFNGGSIATDATLKAITSYPTYDKERWNTAMQAMKAVMDLGSYGLYVDNTTRNGYGYYKVFQKRYNNEYILAKMEGNNTTLESWLRVPSLGDGYRAVPILQMVNSYGMSNGLPIDDPASGYDANNPYLNRDPRFYNSILFNGADWFNTSNAKIKIASYANSGTADAYTNSSVNSSYFIRKMLNEDGTGATERCWPLLRYAEILLGYAEAKNEYSGATTEVYDALKQLRIRAGVSAGASGNYGLKAGMTQEEMRKVIQNEYKVELAFEEHRMWDVRRWKTAMQELNFTPIGTTVTKNANNTYTYGTRNVYTPYLFTEKFYLFPIMSLEIGRSTALVQNPGW
ncbi:RagB/SusD family nutrient uptake outer membrane protein [Pedobacter sp. ASV12]|uniref:RagB/SusD family nutrient uptake outer membrane protein n=1 Tax=Pedobacter sp. ASV12 TaxID=2795120 RepID=UPI0018ECA038|nr:RagB/SusD family nutrient uptake outer membrane protein [Pedobacter sp. ASV12]